MVRFVLALGIAISFAASVHADVLDLLRAGLAARVRGNFDAAISYYTQAIDTGELGQAQLAIVLNARGVAYDVTGEPGKAISDFNVAIQINPDYWEAYSNRGLVWIKKHEYDRAAEDFTAATRDEKVAHLAFNNLANIYAEKGDYDRSIEDYSRAIRLRPDYADAYYGRANIYNELGDTKKAIADFDATIRLNPNHVMALTNRAYAYQIKGEYGRAIPDLDEVIRLQPFSAVVYLYRGVARLYLGSTQAAIQDFANAVRLRPSDAHAVVWLHLARVRAGQDDRSELTRNAASVDRANWPGSLVDLYLSKVSHDSISSAALSNGDLKAQRRRVCEIEFYLATYDLEQGAREEAQQHIRAAAEACAAGGIEFIAARATAAEINLKQ
jgi:tetratricopeptide (TPR) repeat protein